MLTFFEAIVIGIIQGTAEWLPISSEGMTALVLIKFFGKPLSEAIPISIWLHLGTLLAAVVYFREELKIIIKRLPEYFSETVPARLLKKKANFKKKENEEDRLISFLIISTLLTGIIGLPIMLFATEKADISGEAATAAVGIFLILTGLLQRISASTKNMKKLPDTGDALIVGLAQGFSALPGISRSGITTGIFLFRNFDSEKALKFSFLMSIPAVFGAEIGLQIMDMITVDIPSLLAVVFSFVFGLLTIDLFLKIARKVNFSSFCIILGSLTFLSLVL